MKIYVATHKKIDYLPNDKIYVPLHVGAALHDKLPYISDDTGDNISVKNPNFCELTGHYWVWKNSDEDIVGMVHYRRYFSTEKGYWYKLFTGKNGFILSEQDISEALKDHDAIVSTLGHSPRSMKNMLNAYGGSHHRKDLEETVRIILEKYPEYRETVEKDLLNNVEFYPANMIICRKEVFDSYCKWLFDVLLELEKRVDISDYTPYQKRIFGFISERIFKVWLDQNNIRLAERHIINTEDPNMIGFAVKEIKRYFSIRKGDKL